MAEQEHRQARKKSKIYSFARGVATVLFSTLLPVKIEGKDNLPTQLPYIYIGNHKSWLDPVYMAYSVKKEQITFLAKKELFEIPALGKILQKIGMIPVDRNHSDMKAVRACLNALKSNEILGVFPEGTRHKKGVMEDVEGGIALIALRSQAPVIPIYLPHPIRAFHKNVCYIGAPIETQDLIEQGIGKETTEALVKRISDTYQIMKENARKNKK